MARQSYQQVSEVVEEDLRRLRKRCGVETLGEIDSQRYFFMKKQKHPEKYEGLMFDTNGHKPFSEDLSSIIMDLRLCGILENKYDILPE